MTKEKIEELIKKVGLREVVRINNVLAEEYEQIDNIVHLAEEFNSLCKDTKPSVIAKLVSEGYDIEMGDYFSFSDCILFSINCLGDLLVATTKEGVIELLSRTLTYTTLAINLVLNKDYIEKF